jgi:hypothetical protein
LTLGRDSIKAVFWLSALEIQSIFSRFSNSSNQYGALQQEGQTHTFDFCFRVPLNSEFCEFIPFPTLEVSLTRMISD